MLPVVLIGESQLRIKQLQQSFPEQMSAPVRVLEISSNVSTPIPLPALTEPSIIVLDVDGAFSNYIAQYIARLRIAYADSAIVVVLTFGDDDGESAAINTGADDILMKPITPNRIALSFRNMSEMVRLRSIGNSRGDKVVPLRQPVGKMAVSIIDSAGQVKKFHHIEQEIIRGTIAYFDGHISNAARALCIGRSTLYRKIDAETLAQIGRQN